MADIVPTHLAACGKTARYTELERTLREHCLELLNEVPERKRDARSDNAKDSAVLDEGESSEADTQGEIEFAFYPDEGGNAEQDQDGAPPAQGGHLWQLLGLRQQHP